MERKRFKFDGVGNRAVALMLVLALAMSFAPVAGAAPPETTISIDDVEGVYGQTVDVPIRLENPSHLEVDGFLLNITYNAAQLQYVETVQGAISEVDVYEDSAGILNAIWAPTEETVNGNEVLFTLRMRIDETVIIGTEIEVAFDPDQSTVTASGSSPIAVTPVDGKVTVIPGRAAVKIDDAAGEPGDTISVDVSVTEAAYGVAAYGVQVDFDPTKLEFVSVENETSCADAEADCFESHSAIGSVKAAWVDTQGGEAPIVAAHAPVRLFTIKFKIKSGIPVGETNLTVQEGSVDTFTFRNGNGEELIKTLTEGKVTVEEPSLLHIAAVDPLDPLPVPYGTLLNALDLPSHVYITLSDNSQDEVAVTWDGGTPAYVGTTAGTYTFNGTLTLPSGVVNPSNVKATLVVTVLPEVSMSKQVESVEPLDPLPVPNGTPLSELDLPQYMFITLNDDSQDEVAVIWDGGTPTYNGTTAGTYTFIGTLTLPNGVVNPANVKAARTVTVLPAAKNVASVAPLQPIAVSYGTGMAQVALPDHVAVTLNDNTDIQAGVTWDAGTPPYQGNVAGSYTFAGTLTLPNGVQNPGHLKGRIVVTVSAPPTDDPPPTSTPTPTRDDAIEVYIDGVKQEQSATLHREERDGRETAVVTVDETKVASMMESEHFRQLQIPVRTGDASVVGVLNGRIVKSMEDKEAEIVVETNHATYTLPANEVNIDAVAEQFGERIELQDIEIGIVVSKSDEATASEVDDALGEGAERVGEPVDFEVTATYNGETKDINRFNGYVERGIALPDGTDPSKITTGVVLNEAGELVHVPTKVVLRDGTHYAEINSLTNSTYAVIWNPKSFEDLADHWGREDVEDLASRKVAIPESAESFGAERNVSREEFAAMLVRALALKPSATPAAFLDIGEGRDAQAIQAASEFDLIQGYENGSFDPNRAITRSEAFAMVYRATRWTGAEAAMSQAEAELRLAAYSDSPDTPNWAASSIVGLLQAGIVKGTGTALSPNAALTEAEAAALVRRLLQVSELI
jgi:hypothetical protein